MAKKYYSKNSTYSQRDREVQDIPLHTFGLAVPKMGNRACLCADGRTYSRACCNGYLINQGIGIIEAIILPPIPLFGDFNFDFSSDFSIQTE